LLAEDDPLFQHILSRLLPRWGYDVEVATDGPSAWRILQSEDSPRLAILDWMMPGMEGVDICRNVRASGREPYTYILLVTGRNASGDLVEAMNAGADDYLTKPFDAHELRARLRAGSRIVHLQEELLQAREALREQATCDSLTGVLNRASILQRLREEISRAGRSGQPLALLLLDIDHFKAINDTFGHVAGDSVLAETARRMKASLRCYDSLGRYGGEEFLIVLPGCDGAGGRELADRVREEVACAPVNIGGQQIGVACSIGLCWLAGGAEADMDTLVREADLALYVAKRKGRNRVEQMDGDRDATRLPRRMRRVG
jgi:diguanylate cyclase (GGDEF)-like protein